MSLNIDINANILSQNDKKANELRARYKDLGLYVINLMSSAGSGKTTLLESLSTFSDFRFCVCEGDLQTNRDADRLKAKGIEAHQISTGEACHLNANMVESALNALESSCDLSKLEYMFIENVGNLVCPASYDLGAALNIVLLSTPEGDDKILKYPSMFLSADALIISKVDIMEHFSFSLERIKADLSALKHNVPIFLLSSKDKASIEAFKNFIIERKSANYYSSHRF